MKKKIPKHVMIDLETLGRTPDAAIASIGAVLFDPRYGIKCADTFYVEIDWKASKRFVEKETVDWWRKQSKEARKCLKGKTPLSEALEELDFWLPDDCRPWGNGPTFDISMLEHAFDQEQIETPWKFWNIRDCRTIKDIFESKRGGLNGNFTGVKHNSLDDAKYQADWVCTMWANLTGEV